MRPAAARGGLPRWATPYCGRMSAPKTPPHTGGRALRVLVVDDEPGLVDNRTAGFRIPGWDAESAPTGEVAVAKCRISEPDVVVLDIGLPDIDGFEVLARLRALNPEVGVIFLTARDGVDDRVAGIRQGGDDYLTKPFSLEEVIVRAEALVRRRGLTAAAQGDHLAVDDLVINTSTFEVERAGVPIKLTATEFALARHLAENARRVCSKQELLSAVWGEDFAGGEHVVELYISYLRKKIDADGLPLIRTVRGIGYTMRPGA